MRKAIALACLSAAGYLGADDSGLGSNAAAYLHFSLSARAIGMGSAESAVIPEDAGVMHSNPALLALLPAHTVSATSGALGEDRSLYFVGYSAPLVYHRKHDDMDFDTLDIDEDSPGVSNHQNLQPAKNENGDFFALERDPSSSSNFATSDDQGPRWRRAFVETQRVDMAFATGITFFGVSNIEGRSEFGDLQPSFQDTERDFSLSYAIRLYDNFSIGLTGKYLGQTLQSAGAKGLGFDVGTWYGVPHIPAGTLSFSLTARDIGSKLKWTVPDPDLQTDVSYTEPVDTKFVLGGAYVFPNQKFTLAFDAQKASNQSARLYSGAEWRLFSISNFAAVLARTIPPLALV